jgi:hypothetical protein
VYFTAKRLKLYLWALVVVQVFTCLGFRSSILSGAIDFRLYYTAGYMLRTGDAAHLYDYATEQRVQNAVVASAPIALPFFAPPIAALPFVLLSYAPYLSALLIFGCINLVLLVLAVRVMHPYLRALSARWPLTPALLFLSFLPVGLTIVMGQLSILLLLIACFAFALIEAGSPFVAGLIFALALVKFQTAIPVALLFLLWRRWRFTAGFLTGACTLFALSIWIIGFRSLLPYLRSITHMSAFAGTPLQQAVGVAPRAMPNLYGLFFMLAPTNHLATILTLVASLLLILWVARRPPSFPLALLVAILVSYHFYPCDLTLLLLPISLLCNRLFAENASPAAPAPAPQTWLQRHHRQILLCALGALLISPLMVEIISNNLIFLYALPILGLALSPLDWSILTLAPTRTAAAVQPSPA